MNREKKIQIDKSPQKKKTLVHQNQKKNPWENRLNHNELAIEHLHQIY